MPKVNKDALGQAVGDAIDSLLDDNRKETNEEKQVQLVPDGNGCFIVSHPPDPASARAFFNAFEEYLEDEQTRMITEAAEAAMVNYCFHCAKKPCIVSTEYATLTEIGEAMEAEGKSNKEIRFALYRHMSQVYHGHLGAGNRKKLPVCVMGDIKDAYPKGSDEEYVGFKERPTAED